MNLSLISIVLPVYNQASFIQVTVDKYIESLNKIPIKYEIILVVNSHKDDSFAICEKLSKTYPTVKAFQIPQSGWGRAVKFGIKQSQGDFICYTNSARTKAKDLILFLLYSLANPDVVIKANRKIRDSFLRRFGSLFYNIECRSLYDLSNWDVNGTPKVFPRKFKKLLDLTRDDDLIDLEFNYVCREKEYPMLEIPIFFPQRQGGKSTTGLKSAFSMYLGAWRIKKTLENHYKDPHGRA